MGRDFWQSCCLSCAFNYSSVFNNFTILNHDFTLTVVDRQLETFIQASGAVDVSPFSWNSGVVQVIKKLQGRGHNQLCHRNLSER